MSRSSDPRATIREITDAANEDLARLSSDLSRDLANATPRDTGQARRGWREQPTSRLIGTGRTQTLVSNDVDYVQYLNEGHSSQAQSGYIGDVINRVVGSFRGRRS